MPAFAVTVRDNSSGETVSFTIYTASARLLDVARMLREYGTGFWKATSIDSRRHKRR